MYIRKGTMADLEAIAAVEARCFPKAEAASLADFKGRLSVYANHFLLLEKDTQLIGFIDGPVTDESKLRDEMFNTPSFHKEDGAWQMVFGLNVLPEYRRRGFAAQLMEQLIAQAKAEGRTGVVLTCKEALRPYYAKFGFKEEGLSESEHGGAVWYDMRLQFDRK